MTTEPTEPTMHTCTHASKTAANTAVHGTGRGNTGITRHSLGGAGSGRNGNGADLINGTIGNLEMDAINPDNARAKKRSTKSYKKPESGCIQMAHAP